MAAGACAVAFSTSLTMPADTLFFDASQCGFPPPRVSELPTGLQGISFRRQAPWAHAKYFRHFEYGRYALYQAFRLSGIGPATALLAPAYHCRTMLNPALALGAEVLLYPLHADLSPDIAALDSIVEKSPVPIKALLATHFFGFPQDFVRLATWCASKNILLIEDCSHAFFSEYHRPPAIGSYGDYVVSSPYKLLSSPNGGLLYSQDEQLSVVQTRPPSWRAELIALKNFIQAAHRANDCDPARLENELAQVIAHPCEPALERRAPTIVTSNYAANAEKSSLRFSRWIYRHPDTEGVASMRRDNYRCWIEGTSNLPYCRPLFPELPEGCIPYMFPLLIDHPETHFYWLKQLGVPIWRWDTLVISDCPTARHYRLHLLHLPCHQSLSKTDLEWMITAVQKLGAGRTAPEHFPAS